MTLVTAIRVGVCTNGWGGGVVRSEKIQGRRRQGLVSQVPWEADGPASVPGAVWLSWRGRIWIDIVPASRRKEEIATSINWNGFEDEVDGMSYILTFMDE